MKQMRDRLTYANAMSSIAVFFVPGGTTVYAAGAQRSPTVNRLAESGEPGIHTRVHMLHFQVAFSAGVNTESRASRRGFFSKSFMPRSASSGSSGWLRSLGGRHRKEGLSGAFAFGVAAGDGSAHGRSSAASAPTAPQTA